MKKYIPLIIACASVIISGQNNQNDEYKKQIERMLNRSDVNNYTMKYFADVAKFTFEKMNGNDKWGSKYQAAIESANINAKKFTADFQKIISENKYKADKERIVFKTAEYSSRLIMSPIESVPIWGPIQREINNQIFQAAEDELTNNYKRRLANSLEQIRNTNQERYNAIIKSGNYDEVKQALDEVNYFSNSEFSGVDPEYQEIIQKSQQKFLQETVKESLERVISDLGDQQIEIDSVNKNISRLSKFTYKFAEESNKRFDTLYHAQARLNKNLAAFYKNHKKDKKALDFMQDFLYSKMNPTEKIAALNAGLLSNISPQERERLRAELQREEDKRKVVESIKEYLNSASIAIKILGDLQLGDSKLVQDISKGVNIGQAAVAAVEAFTSGNYLACISNITGLFAKRGEDPTTQRHRQIMQRFDRIDESLNRIEGKINRLLTAQQTMLDLQVKTFNEILTLSNKIDSTHMEVMKKLNTIENALYENRQLIMNDWEGKCQACLETIKTVGMDIDNGILPENEKLEAEYVDLKMGEFFDCEQYIRKVVFYIDPQIINPYFYLTSSINGTDISGNYNKLKSINERSFNLLYNYDKQIGNINNSELLLYSLFFPSTSVSELNNKIKADTVILESSYYPSDREYFTQIIKPEVSIRHGEVVRNIGFLRSLTDEDRNLITWEDFASENPPVHRTALRYLEYALELNNISIAQQAILAGDILLPIIFNEEYDFSLGKGDTLRFLTCQSLLESNELLANNFSSYFVGAYLRRTSESAMQYGYAFNSKDSLIMSKVIKSVFPISYIKTADSLATALDIEEGWYLTIGESRYLLPDPAQIDRIPLIQSHYLADLLNNREKLLQQIFSIRAYDNNIVENMNYLIMKN